MLAGRARTERFDRQAVKDGEVAKIQKKVIAPSHRTVGPEKASRDHLALFLEAAA
jgi:hypothetical protein